MKAIVQDTYGSTDVLEFTDIDPPEVGDDDVLIRVHAAGVDPGVWHLMTGLPYLVRLGFGLRAPKTRIRGMDVAGHVEAVGKKVTQVHTGDDVFGTCDGSFAEYACAKENRIAPKPANLTFEQAAAVPVSAGGDRWIGGTHRQLRALVLSPFVRHNLRSFLSTERTEDLQFLKELIEGGKVTPVIDRTYPLSEVPEAIRYLEDGHARGKVVISV